MQQTVSCVTPNKPNQVKCVSSFSPFFPFFSPRSTSARMSGTDLPWVDQNDTAMSPADDGTFLRFSPTSSSSSTSAAASLPGRLANVYVYVWLFLGLLVFLLTLLIISLHRLKNIISSSSSIPDCSSEAGSSFTNMEICSISSQRSAISSLSTWERSRTHGQMTMHRDRAPSSSTLVCPNPYRPLCLIQLAKKILSSQWGGGWGWINPSKGLISTVQTP